MFDIPISKMNDKQLRNAVQLLYDELAIFKRKYEDAIHNLDSDNFSRNFTVEQDGMKSQIKMTADAIQVMVSDTDLEKELENYAKTTWTADRISSVVSKGANLKGAEKINSLDKRKDTSKIYCYQEETGEGKVFRETYYYYDDILNSWQILSGDSIYTVFNQTSTGFELKGNVLIDGDTVITRNLKLSGNVTWDMSNSPVLTQYSSDTINWHSPMADGDTYMRMSFDGGHNWSTATKVVGKDGRDGNDGQNGTDGSDADVTPENVFNALTGNGDTQGLFSAFVEHQNKLYINAEYLATKIADVADEVRLGSNKDDVKKKIVFSDGALIQTFSDGLGWPTGLELSGSTVKINSKLDLSGCSTIYWGENAPEATFG